MANGLKRIEERLCAGRAGLPRNESEARQELKAFGEPRPGESPLITQWRARLAAAVARDVTTLERLISEGPQWPA